MTIGETRRTDKRKASAEIELLTWEFLNEGGEIKQLETQESKFRPTWEAYANSAFEERNDE